MSDAPADISLTSAPVITDAVHNIGMIALALLTGVLNSNPALGWVPEVLSSVGALAFAGLSAVHVAKTSFLGRVLSSLTPGFTTTAA